MDTLSDRDHWLRLFSALLDGTCDASGQREALHVLSTRPAARRDFAELSQLHCWLAEDAEVQNVIRQTDSVPDNIIPLPGAAQLPPAAADDEAVSAAAAAPVMPDPAEPCRAEFDPVSRRSRVRRLVPALGAAAVCAAMLPAGAWVIARQFIDPVIPGRAPGETSLAHWQPVDEERELRPVLARCQGCHSAEAGHTHGGGTEWSFPPRLETAASGIRLIVAGKPAQSALWLRIARAEEVSDPHSSLTDSERTVIRRWIEQQA